MVEADPKPPQTIEDPPLAQTNTIVDEAPKPAPKMPNTALAGAMMLMGGAKKKDEAAKPAA